MKSLLYSFATALMLGTFSSLAAAQSPLTTKNWEQAGKIARNQSVPIVMVVTGNGCGHCERMEREFLANPTIRSFLRRRAVVRIYHEDTGGKLWDFDGERMRARMFFSRYGVFATPTLLFLDSDGRPIADPLVGYDDAVNYLDLVTGRLDQAQLALEAGKGPGASAVAATQH